MTSQGTDNERLLEFIESSKRGQARRLLENICKRERSEAAIEELESLLPLTEIAKKPEHLGRVIRSHLSRYNRSTQRVTLSQEDNNN